MILNYEGRSSDFQLPQLNFCHIKNISGGDKSHRFHKESDAIFFHSKNIWGGDKWEISLQVRCNFCHIKNIWGVISRTDFTTGMVRCNFLRQ